MLTVKDILNNTNSKLLNGNVNTIVEDIIINSTQVINNSCFFGIKGNNTDGSLYYKEALEKALVAAAKEHEHSVEGHHHHHHHDHDHECEDEHCECHHHDEHDHEHHHDHDEHEHEHHHHHHHHHDGEAHPHTDDGDTKLYYNEEDAHDADEVFQSIGVETAHTFTPEEIKEKLDVLTNDDSVGNILRAKGIVKGTENKWYEFDYVAGDSEIRETTPDVGGRLVVIGENLDAKKLYDLMKG